MSIDKAAIGTLSGEFPEYPEASLPEDLQNADTLTMLGLKPSHWRNDICPSWEIVSTKAEALKEAAKVPEDYRSICGAALFVDYLNESDREHVGGRRYMFLIGGETIYETDVWSRARAFLLEGALS